MFTKHREVVFRGLFSRRMQAVAHGQNIPNFYGGTRTAGGFESAVGVFRAGHHVHAITVWVDERERQGSQVRIHSGAPILWTHQAAS